MSIETFRVFKFYQKDKYDEHGTGFDPENAVLEAKALTESEAAVSGEIVRIIITDTDDCCCFDWVFGIGVVFPTREQCAEITSGTLY